MNEIYFIMHPKSRFIVLIMSYELVKTFMHFFRDFLRFHGPQRLNFIHAIVVQINTAIDEVTVLLYDACQSQTNIQPLRSKND